jgi:hypothetical protein
MSDTVIIKRKVRRDFTTLPNDLIRDSRISWGALGLLVYILSLPDDFRLRLCHLAKQKSCGRDATRARAKELENAGYLLITRERGTHGRFSNTLWEVSDTPTLPTPTPPRSDFPNVVEPGTENPNTVPPSSEDPTLLNTDTEQVLREKRTTTTKPFEYVQLPAHADLEYPVGIPASDIPAVAKALSTVPVEDAQTLLDELAGALSQVGAIRTTPIRWFFGLLKRYEKGQFCPTHKQPARDRQKRDQVAVPARPVAAKEVAIAHLKGLKAGLGRGLTQ